MTLLVFDTSSIVRSWLGGDCGAIPFNGSQTLGNNWTRIQLNLDEDHFDAHDNDLIGIREES